MKKEQALRKVVFLDTMTLHYIRLCLEYAIEKQLQFPRDNTAIIELKKYFDNVRDDKFREAMQKGLITIIELSKFDVQIEYASVSEIEMITGLTEGKVRLALAREGVPHRIWSGFSEKETRDRITTEELESIKTRIDELGSMLERSGLTVMRSDTRREGDVLKLAKGIVGLIYMREIDSIIFASAIAAGADCLITADAHLISSVNAIHAGRDRYREIRQKLKELINMIIPGGSDDIRLPQALTFTHAGKTKGIALHTLTERLT